MVDGGARAAEQPVPTSGPRAEYAMLTPGGPLTGLVHDVVGYDVSGQPPGVHRGLPSRHLTLVLTTDEPVRVAHGDAAPVRYGALAGGLAPRAVGIHHDGVQHGVTVQLTPAGARALLGLPAGELAGHVAPLDTLLGARADRLRERVAEDVPWPRRLEAVAAELRLLLDDRSTATCRGPADEVRHAWRRLVGAGGRLPVSALAAEVGWSRRHLTGRFVAEVGLSPTLLGRVLRFERSRQRLLAATGPPRLAEVAVGCGYADQAHLAREWRDLAGCPPSVWLAEERPWLQLFPDVQAGSPTEGAGWRHDHGA